MANEYGNTYDKGIGDMVSGYTAKAQEGYLQDMGDEREQAMRELDMELTGQDAQGGLSKYRKKALDQGFDDEADRFEAGTGLLGAGVGEGMRQDLQQRSWNAEDRDRRIARLRKQAADEKERLEKESNANFWRGATNKFGQVAGTIVGTVYGGPVGGAAGGAVGGSIGDIFFGGN